jgi:hypothetical protein
MPVSEIHAVLAASDPIERNAMIAAHLRRLEAELSRTQSAVASLRDILEHRSLKSAQVSKSTLERTI